MLGAVGTCCVRLHGPLGPGMTDSDDFLSERVTGVCTKMSGRFGELEFSDVFVFTDTFLKIA